MSVTMNINRKSLNENIILCGDSLKKGEICKNKENPKCNGKCKKDINFYI